MKCSREFDDNGYVLAKLQANIFARASEENIPSSYFVKVYINSDYVRLMDNLDYFYTNLGENIIFEDIKSKVKMNRGTILDASIMHWIGYLYREWAYLFKKRSKALLKQIPISYLAKVYSAYHTVSIKKAIEMIAYDRNINIDETSEERLFRLMKKHYANKLG